MVAIPVRFNNIEHALKMLKKKMQYEGIFRVLKNKKYYEKPSEEKIRKKKESVKKRRSTNRSSQTTRRTTYTS